LSKETVSGKRVYDNWKYSPPAGCVFAYNSNVKDFKTFKRWFTPKNSTVQAKELPTLVGCLDQGILVFRDTFPRDNNTQLESFTFPVRDESGNIVESSNTNTQKQNYNGVSYPVKKVDGKSMLIDQSRILLLFVLYLYELIRIKEPNPRMELPIHYLNILEDMALKT